MEQKATKSNATERQKITKDNAMKPNYALNKQYMSFNKLKCYYFIFSSVRAIIVSTNTATTLNGF